DRHGQHGRAGHRLRDRRLRGPRHSDGERLLHQLLQTADHDRRAGLCGPRAHLRPRADRPGSPGHAVGEAQGRVSMNIFEQALVWLNDPLNWTNPDGILARTAEHLWISLAAVVLGVVVAVPIGVWLGHSGRGGGLVVAVANLTRAI